MSDVERAFLDTNIVIYSVDIADPAKQRTAQLLQSRLISQHHAVVSTQVIQEFLNTCLRKLKTQLTAQDALDIAERILWPICKVSPSYALHHRAIALHQRLGFSFYDSLIVAAALQAGCTRLYSEDLQHGQQIERLTIVNPFLPDAPSHRANAAVHECSEA